MLDVLIVVVDVFVDVLHCCGFCNLQNLAFIVVESVCVQNSSSEFKP